MKKDLEHIALLYEYKELRKRVNLKGYKGLEIWEINIYFCTLYLLSIIFGLFNSLNFSFIIEKLRINFVLLLSFQKLCSQQNVHAHYPFFLRCHSVTQTQVWLLAAQKSIPERQLLIERKVHISPECQQSGEKGRLMPPKKTIPKILLSHESFKGQGESNLS